MALTPVTDASFEPEDLSSTWIDGLEGIPEGGDTDRRAEAILKGSPIPDEEPLDKGAVPAEQPQPEPSGHVGAVMGAMRGMPSPETMQALSDYKDECSAQSLGRFEPFQKAESEIGGEGYQPSDSADQDVVVPTIATVAAFDQVDQDVSDEDDEPGDSLTRETEMVARESKEKYPEYWTNKSVDTSGIDALTQALEDDQLEKAYLSAEREMWWNQFRGTPFAVEAMELEKENIAFKKTRPKFKEPDPENIAAYAKYMKAKKAYWDQDEAIEKKAKVLEGKLLDHRIAEEKEYQAMNSMSKSGVAEDNVDATQRSNDMTGIDGMTDFLEKAGGLPEGANTMSKEKSSAQGGSADGGSLEGTGTTTGAIPAAPGPGQDADGQIKGAPAGKAQKLSEDDAEVDGQMQPHKKPIETTKKSTAPSDQRESVAHANAIVASRLRKSAEHRYVSADEQAAELVKGEGFYTGDSPTLDMRQGVDLTAIQNCRVCENTFSKSLSACPECGDGSVTSRPMPGLPHIGQPMTQTADPSQGMLRKSYVEPDIQYGGPVQPIRVANSSGGGLRRR